MPLDFSDLIPAKPQGASISFDDLIPKKTATPPDIYNEFGAVPMNTAAATAGVKPLQTDESYAGTGAEGMAPDQRSPIADSLGRIGSAAAKGFSAASSPEGEAALNRGGPLNQQIITPALKLAGGAVSGGMAALSQTLMEVFGEKGGRDALALLSVLPVAKGEAMSPHPVTAPTTPETPRFVSERVAPDVSQLDTRNAIQTLIGHDIMENGAPAPGRGTANQSLATVQNSVMAAPDLDSAISAARSAAGVTPYKPVTVAEVAARDGVDVNEAYRRMVAENAARREPPEAPQPASSLVHVDDAGNALEPQSAGAAASRDQTPQSQIDLTFDDMKANRRRAEMDELLARPEPNDKTIYVKGSFPTLAERTGDPVTSQTEHLLRERNAGAFIGDGKILTENNRARVSAFDDHTVPDPTLNTMRKERSAQWVAASDDILPSARSADLTPAWEWVSQELDKPRIQENDAVRSVLEDFRDRLVGDDGSLKDDPAAVWGMHDHLQNLLAKAKDPLNMTGAEKFAESQILAAKALVDQALNVATDGKFAKALADYAEASKAINSGVLLNEFRPKLTNMQGELQAAAFHRFVVGLAKERGDPGIDPSMDISDATMRALINIDADLKRAGLIRLGGALGSPTNLLGALAEKAGVGAAHSVLGSVPGIGPILKAGADFVGQRRMDALTQKHIAPPEGGYIYHPSLIPEQ